MSDLHLEQLTDNTPVVEVISFKIFYCRVATASSLVELIVAWEG